MLGIETAVIVPIWITQLTVTKKRVTARTVSLKDNYYPYYFTYADLGLAIAFAVVHSLRGTVDLFVWLGTFTIGCSDFKYLHYHFKKKFSKHPQQLIPPHICSPLIKKDSAVNRALRKNTMYCINIGILDAVTLHMEHQIRADRVGSVRESFVAAAMMQFDEENQQKRTAELYKNPNYREQSLRKIQFPASSSLRIQGFTFVDLEPSVFNMLRNCYGICLLYTSPSPRDATLSRMPSSA